MAKNEVTRDDEAPNWTSIQRDEWSWNPYMLTCYSQVFNKGCPFKVETKAGSMDDMGKGWNRITSLEKTKYLDQF